MIAGVPAGPRRLAFRAFCQVIMQAPTLANRRVIKTWQLYDGTPLAEVTDDMMPCARIRSLGGPVERLASEARPGGDAAIITRSTPTVQIELWTKGTDQGDPQDIGDLIEDALFPRDPVVRIALRAKLRAFGIADWQVTHELAPRDAAAFDNASILSLGEYQLTLHLSD